MFCYKAVIQYDGTDYFGWQSQPSQNTVQDFITNAINQISSEQVNLVGSGRTDSGVHALGQVANFTLNSEVDIRKFMHSLNSVLPPSISIISMEKVDSAFNSRFDAKRRVYIYLINKIKSPFFDKYSYFNPVAANYEIERLNQLSSILIGSHDFSAFCRVKTDTNNKICNVSSVRWRNTKNFLLFRIEADRFLHGMVRTVVGTILRAYPNNEGEEYLIKVLQSKNRNEAADAVPAKGLFLYKVTY